MCKLVKFHVDGIGVYINSNAVSSITMYYKNKNNTVISFIGCNDSYIVSDEPIEVVAKMLGYESNKQYE